MESFTSLVSISAIMELPWYVGLAGLGLVAFFVWSALWSLLKIRPVRALTRLILALALLLILSQAGDAIVQLIGAAPPAE